MREDLDNKTYLNEVTADNNKAKKLNIESVPAVFVNGKKWKMHWIMKPSKK